MEMKNYLLLAKFKIYDYDPLKELINLARMFYMIGLEKWIVKYAGIDLFVYFDIK